MDPSFLEMDMSPPASSHSESPAPSFSQESRTLSAHSRHSSQSSSSVITRWPSPVLRNDESPEQAGSSDEYETFSEYADDRYPILWYGVLLLDPFTAHLRVPAAVSRLIEDLEERHVGTHPPSRRSVRDSNELHMLWEHSTREDIRLYFQGSGISLFPGEQSLLHNVSGELIYHHLMRRIDSRFTIQAPAPDVMYGYQEAALRRPDGIPSWVIDDGKATESILFYPFLTVQMQGHGLGSDGCMHRATNECMIASSICVRMLDKLNQRLAVRQRGDTFTMVNSAAFSIAMNGAVARIYVTFAFDETRDHVYKVDSFVLENPSHYRKFHRFIQSIIDWGKNERLREIRDAIEVIENRGPRWYPRYEL
ncbi:hypothetical protein CEP51_002968 [Fusarium floridanum]|uniref:DUF7924 domain-containing protein n=1 Tax=Fusarium floridanum TaxID=1325733 RepID=A0A428S8H1_9HYPO|nr:hypothetical protein CEP51_002968 [Fusarium floridanum]